VLWWLLAFLSIVGIRWEKIVANGNSFSDILPGFWKDLPLLLGLLALGFLIVIPLWLIGWLISLTGLGESSD
jgi:hypothetical protein